MCSWTTNSKSLQLRIRILAGYRYSVKKAASGALQHLEFAVQAEGVTSNIKTHAAAASGSLKKVLEWTEQAVTNAQKIRMTSSTADAAALTNQLAALTKNIAD